MGDGQTLTTCTLRIYTLAASVVKGKSKTYIQRQEKKRKSGSKTYSTLSHLQDWPELSAINIHRLCDVPPKQEATNEYRRENDKATFNQQIRGLIHCVEASFIGPSRRWADWCIV